MFSRKVLWEIFISGHYYFVRLYTTIKYEKINTGYCKNTVVETICNQITKFEYGNDNHSRIYQLNNRFWNTTLHKPSLKLGVGPNINSDYEHKPRIRVVKQCSLVGRMINFNERFNQINIANTRKYNMAFSLFHMNRVRI